METTHRKIELQSPADLTYLISNATRAAREKIDLHFPPSAAPLPGSDEEDDAMKKRVEELVHEYLQKTFENAKANLSVNGLEGKEMEEEMKRADVGGEELEAYDTRLASKILKTSAQIEALQLQLANLRRAAPAQAAVAYSRRTQEEEKVFLEMRDRAEKEKIEVGVKEARDLGLDVEEKMGRWDEMAMSWERGTRVLGEVKGGIGGTNARAAQARDAVGYLEMERKREG